jgi:hypothetical protein
MKRNLLTLLLGGETAAAICGAQDVKLANGRWLLSSRIVFADRLLTLWTDHQESAMQYSPFRSCLGAVALGLVLSAPAVRAELAEFELSGVVSTVGSNGDPSFLERLAELGVVPGAPLEATLVYDTETPPTASPGSYDRAVRFARVRIEDYELRGPLFVGPFANARVTIAMNGGLIFRVSSTQMEDAPDVLMPEADNGSQIFEFAISGEPFFESLDLPSELPDLSAGAHTSLGRFFGFDPLAHRFGIGFEIHSIRRVSADGPPLSGGEPLLGLELGRRSIRFWVTSTGCTRRSDFAVDVADGEVLLLRLRRLEPDSCNRMQPRRKSIVFAHRALGILPGDHFQVVNPLAVVEVPAHPRGR